MKFILSPLLKMVGIPLFWLLYPLWFYKCKATWKDDAGFIMLNVWYCFSDPYSFFSEFANVGEFYDFCYLLVMKREREPKTLQKNYTAQKKYECVSDAELKKLYGELNEIVKGS